MKRLQNVAVVLGAAILILSGCSDDAAVTNANTTAAGNGVCLQVADIDHTDIQDETTILFTMKGGKVWKNVMPFSCPALKIEEGFAYQTEVAEVCSNAQTIRVLRSGNFCELGQFTPYTPPAPVPAPAKP